MTKRRLRELRERLRDHEHAGARPARRVCSPPRPRPEADTVVTAVVGMIGLKPTLAAIEQGKRIALANKETLVCAGELVMAAAEKLRRGDRAGGLASTRAIFQCLQGCRDRGEIKRLILTCSGGPFYRSDPRAACGQMTRAGRAASPQLDDGREDHRRLRDADEQGP